MMAPSTRADKALAVNRPHGLTCPQLKAARGKSRASPYTGTSTIEWFKRRRPMTAIVKRGITEDYWGLMSEDRKLDWKLFTRSLAIVTACRRCGLRTSGCYTHRARTHESCWRNPVRRPLARRPDEGWCCRSSCWSSGKPMFRWPTSPVPWIRSRRRCPACCRALSWWVQKGFPIAPC
jgi:hypothetical protein